MQNGGVSQVKVLVTPLSKIVLPNLDEESLLSQKKPIRVEIGQFLAISRFSHSSAV